jgi:hypothetical protein
MNAHNCTGISNIHDMSSGMKYNEVSQMQVWGEVKVNWQKKPMGATQEPRTGTNLLTRECIIWHSHNQQKCLDPGVCDKIQARDIQPLLLVVMLRKGETVIATEPWN